MPLTGPLQARSHSVSEVCSGGNLYKWRAKESMAGDRVSESNYVKQVDRWLKAPVPCLGGPGPEHYRSGSPQVLRPLLAALDKIHQLGLNHLSLKPENILFTSDGTLKMSDVCMPPIRCLGPYSEPATRAAAAALGMGGGDEELDDTEPLQLRALQYIAPEASLRLQRRKCPCIRSKDPCCLPGRLFTNPADVQALHRMATDPTFDGKATGTFVDAIDVWAIAAITLEILVRDVISPAAQW